MGVTDFVSDIKRVENLSDFEKLARVKVDFHCRVIFTCLRT